MAYISRMYSINICFIIICINEIHIISYTLKEFKNIYNHFFRLLEPTVRGRPPESFYSTCFNPLYILFTLSNHLSELHATIYSHILFYSSTLIPITTYNARQQLICSHSIFPDHLFAINYSYSYYPRLIH